MSKASSNIDKRYLDLAGMITANIHLIPANSLDYYLSNRTEIPEALLRTGFVIPEQESKKTEAMVEIHEEKSSTLILTPINQTFPDWLKAREEIHKFLTGETVILRDMFAMDDELLARTDIMPTFRPAGATNRMALDWKVKLGMNKSYEETNVMKYKNSEGPAVPELCFINRSVTPDKDTLGKKAKSPDQLLAVPNSLWTNLYGWSDADNLHFLILGVHLDSGETVNWFPDDRLPAGNVAYGYWFVSDVRAEFLWYGSSFVYPSVGARLANSVPLRKS